MCKSNAEGGKRCDSHNAEASVKLTAEIQNKVLSSMQEHERENLEALVDGYDTMVELSKQTDFSNEKGSITTTDNDEVNERVYNNPSWGTAQTKMSDANDKYIDYYYAVEMIKNPTDDSKRAYLTEFDPEYAKASEDLDKLEDKIYGRYPTISEATKLDKLRTLRAEKVFHFKTPSPEEIQALSESNPYAEEREKTRKKFFEVESKLKEHYRKDQVYNNSDAYREAYNAYMDTPEGKKISTKLAESRVHESISSKAMDGTGYRIRAYEKRGKEAEANLAKKNLLARQEVSKSYEYSNKYSHVKKLVNESKDVSKTMTLPSKGNSQSVTVQTSSQFEKTMHRANEAWGHKYENETPEKRRQLVAGELFSRKGVTSVQEISSNPVIRGSMDNLDEAHSEVRAKAVSKQLERITRRHNSSEGVQLENLRKKLIGNKDDQLADLRAKLMGTKDDQLADLRRKLTGETRGYSSNDVVEDPRLEELRRKLIG